MKPSKAVLIGYAVGMVPVLVIVVAIGAIGWTAFGPGGAAAGAVVAAAAGWPVWALAIRHWRRWAIGAGVPATDLQRWGVAFGLVGPSGSRLEQSEHTANVPLFWGLIAGGFPICAGLALELSRSPSSSVHALSAIGFLLIAVGIAIDGMRREPPLATWLGIGALFVASAVEWLFLGWGLGLWVWMPIKVLPFVAGVGSLVVLAWIPVRERRDARGLLPARLSLVASVGLIAILTPVAIIGIPALHSNGTAVTPTPAHHDPFSFSTGSTLPATRLTDGLAFADVAVGTGTPAAAGECLGVQYVVWLSDGKRIDSSSDHSGDFMFTIGNREVIQGWDEGLLGMKVGGVRRLTVPPTLAYGGQGNGAIPPQATIVFVVKLTSIGQIGC